MSLWKDAQSPALKTVWRAGQRMGEMRLGMSRAAGSPDQPAAQTRSVPSRTDRNRAALHQVWKR